MDVNTSVESRPEGGQMTKIQRDGDKFRITVRCFALPHGDQVMAKCIDLDLAVVRPTVADARRELRNQITSYLATVGARGWADMLSRPAPLSDRVLFNTLWTLHRVTGAWARLSPLKRADVWADPAPVPAAS